MHRPIPEAIRRQPTYRTLLERMPRSGERVAVTNLPGALPAALVATLSRDLDRRMWVVVAPDPTEAEAVTADLEALLDPAASILYPQREALPFEAEDHHIEVSGQRVEALEALLAGRVRVLVTTSRAIQELERIPRDLADLRFTVELGQAIRPTDLVGRLEDMGFERTGLVEQVGEYAARGGILDLFSFGSEDPVRIEFWGDEIASIRQFDILDQRSSETLRRADLLPVELKRAGEGGSARRSLLDMLPGDTVLVQLDEGADRSFRKAWEKLLELHAVEARRGRQPDPPEHLLLPPDTVRARLADFGLLVSAADGDRRFDARPPESIDRDTARL
jgi:transcription-repair coupling factor (superfamily II helicase)